MQQFCLCLDLKNDPQLIAQYDRWHRSENVWSEIVSSIKSSGIVNMEIYRTGNRLFMHISATDEFDFKKKSAMDAANSKVQEWETLMSQFQQSLPWAKAGEKWVLMEKIFQL